MGISSILLSALIAGGALALPAAEPVSFDIRDENITLARRAEAINYNQDYIASGANVQYSPNMAAGSFSINYNTQGDFVVGLGWQPGDANPITYSGSFSASGVGILAVYGWSTNPLVEYYVMEVHDGYQTAGTHKGTVTTDGGTYDIWEHQQVNQPSILGTSTFNQYISIRQSPRTSGTVTVQNHFNAWAQAGMNLGTLNYQVMAVESWSGSGSGQISLSKGTGGGSTTTTPTGPTSTSTAPSSGGTGAAQWGQCGGIGWTGPTTCVAPYTCKYENAYYSQCQ
uniref:Endo-1,4-beta-xylanase B n=1 Tax=Talaromyces funiculosus TaxID=28572 RepID=XYNB_TALFU|nr:RecName: Full=Endo-1,4-beta-xylanase B; Short=Xylanase B; AltName: Full=1,4-beta-D-xylan xylanohydrolase B; Flags: Precursor [Talaromyces funiculosus]CAD33900.1 endo-1,4-xylanase B [Talaromyces funiculosus]